MKENTDTYLQQLPRSIAAVLFSSTCTFPIINHKKTPLTPDLDGALDFWVLNGLGANLLATHEALGKPGMYEHNGNENQSEANLAATNICWFPRILVMQDFVAWAARLARRFGQGRRQ